MSDDVNLLWTLVSGVMLLVMAAGVGAVIEGFTRSRSVSTGAGRHVATSIGAIVGVFVVASTEVLTTASGSGGDLWLLIGSSVLLATIVSGGIVERGTFVAHCALGVVVGGVVVPAVEWARVDGGVLDSIAVDGVQFTDAAAATLFSVAGWMALVGIMVIGPRRGRLGPEGQLRAIPGKSMPAAAVGALAVLATAIGASGRAQSGWSESVIEAAGLITLSSAVGASVWVLVTWRRVGASSTSSLVHGAIAGVVSALGAPLDLSLARAIVVGAVGALLAMASVELMNRAKIDDPVSIVSIFGVAGVWGTLAAASTSNGVVAQLVGLLIVAAWSVVSAGLIFGFLRAVGLLRVSAEVEIVGLER